MLPNVVQSLGKCEIDGNPPKLRQVAAFELSQHCLPLTFADSWGFQIS